MVWPLHAKATGGTHPDSYNHAFNFVPHRLHVQSLADSCQIIEESLRVCWAAGIEANVINIHEASQAKSLQLQTSF